MTSGTTSDPTGLLLPPHARAFHIGPPKTATTSIQQAASMARSQLLEHGVLYPGKEYYNHRLAIAAYMGRGAGWREEGEENWVMQPPPMRHWRALMAEIEREKERRIWFGHEYAASATDDMLRDWADQLGPDLHILITLRPLSAMMPSMWQETLKGAARRASFDLWLRHVFDPERPAHHKLMLRNDQGALARRWAKVVGTENVTVIVLDRKDHDFVYRTFESLFGLPPGLLVNADKGSRGDNRSMSIAEIELIRKLNIALRELGVDYEDHARLIYRGAAARLQRARTPGPDEPKLGLPRWAAERAHAMEEEFVADLLSSGVRIVGDPANLVGSGPSASEPVDHREVDSVPLDVAVQALVGVVAAATGRGVTKFDKTQSSVTRKLAADVKVDSALAAGLGLDSLRRLQARVLRLGAGVRRRLRR